MVESSNFTISLKKLFSILFILVISVLHAQLDTEHWFAPMVKRATNQDNYMSLYLSTNETIPFVVTIENNNQVIAVVEISKGNPEKVSINEFLMKTYSGGLTQMKTNLGLHVFAEKKFFANLRFSTVNHAEIITSKGRAGLGTHFRAVYAPFSQSNEQLNYNISFIATEDNTEVNFLDKIIYLDKGESYIQEGFPYDNSAIGREIISNKPISIVNGNFNGQYASSDDRSGTDILMDQGVPIERLGKEYIVMKGNGAISVDMESAIIVATEDNTEVFFNDEIQPYSQTLNKGEYILMPSSKYILKNMDDDVYSAYIRTTKNVYVYQLLSGSGSLAAGGFNYIPPLNCYLPKKIDELAFIDENEVYSVLFGETILYKTHPTKLNIITQSGATVLVNGELLNGNSGPYETTGTSEWVTFSVPKVSGTIVIESDKAVTAGIAAGNQAIGYGGYFAGASSMPVITKSGECIPGVKLEVDDTFDSYQWQKMNVSIGLFESITDADSYIYTPVEVGEYRCVLGSEVCGTIETPSYEILNCTIESEINTSICDAYTLIPEFTNSQQAVNINKTRVNVQPINGNVSIINGILVYTPNSGLADGTKDTFTFYIEGDAAYPDSELITVNIEIIRFTVKDAEIFGCLINGKAIYNLAETQVTDETNVSSITYFEDLFDAENNVVNNEIIDYENYETNLPKVYARVQFSLGCSLIATITLSYFPVPDLDVTQFNSSICDDNLDGWSNDIYFSEDVIPKILSDFENYSVNFYLDEAHTLLLQDQWSFNTDTTVYIEVINSSGCILISDKINFSIGDRISINNVDAQTVCDNELSGSVDVELSDYIDLFTDDTSVSVTYYTSESDAKERNGEISSSITLSNSSIYYLRFENSTYCPEIKTLKLTFSQPQTSDVLEDTIICADDTTTLSVEENTFNSILWSTGSTDTSVTVGVGDYYVDLTTNLCTYRQNVSVSAAENPIIFSIEISGDTATIIGSGGIPEYQYSVDNQNFNDINVFGNLTKGKHTAYLIDNMGCIVVSEDFYIIKIFNAITPNGDGFNDVLDYSDLQYKDNVSMEIYDRYGKMIFKGTPQNQYIWDGTSNSRLLSTDSYWFVIEWQEPTSGTYKKYADWILLKNRN